jgi:hypothetical protein
MYEGNAALIVATWGPALVLLFAVLLAVWLTRDAWKRKTPRTPARSVNYAIPSSGDSDELNIALKSATALNAYNVHAQTKIIVRKPSLIAQFSFRDRRSDAVGLASFYVTAFTLIVAIIAIVIQ